MIGLIGQYINAFALALIAAIAGVMIKKMQKRIDAAEEEQKQRDKDHQKILFLLIQMSWAEAALSEANAIAIESGRCNGEMKKALEYMQEVKHEQKETITKLGLKEIF